MDIIGFFTSPIMLDILVKLLVATVLSLIIGLERELIHKPAGIKTHMLICMSSTLVMALGIHLFDKFPNSIDPSRLPAQILAGIGFVGAGTIIRDGFSVKGITTAASLLLITCIGLTIGAGFYEAALIATLFAFLTLSLTTPLQQLLHKNKKIILFTITAKSTPDVIGTINNLFESKNASVLNIRQIRDDVSQYTLLKFLVKLNNPKEKEILIQKVCELDDIKEVYTSKKTYHSDEQE
ncbi:MAG: MgtC/SapB family protein [Clostridia bacterium]|nr:MgtC/SapB family protein [Clostridia bacterium]